ncbi:hypothetical protein CAPTEDRAFT_205428 [Capitella teleta]|uniref:Aminoglycoside phosphotransferase domain-containing protein n=1 Tax=Capitella teleta TaxID=283909 RepID=R7TJS0_CAPTE|nr:hypothetical protein CAPTEDRAFT_205428 [Capitella teleta]|eukprot:ELT91786.1 hypothetical protein CAPTEDRAFT_205428 [Capitella teleta]
MSIWIDLTWFYCSLTARAMVKIHLIKPAEFLPPTLTINQEPDLFQNLHKCLDLLSQNFDDQGKNPKLQELKKAYDFADEVELLEKELLPLQSPVVLCHNDAAANNIIYKPGEEIENGITLRINQLILVANAFDTME